jgi:hypothetical protein
MEQPTSLKVSNILITVSTDDLSSVRLDLLDAPHTLFSVPNVLSPSSSIHLCFVVGGCRQFLIFRSRGSKSLDE